MKRTFVYLIAILISFSAAHSIEFDLYVKGGASSSFLDFEKDIYDGCRISVAHGGKVVGAHIGIMGHLHLPLFPLSLETEVVFMYTGGALDVENKTEVKVHNITERIGRFDIPIRAAYSIGPISLKAGIAVNLHLFTNEEFKDLIQNEFAGLSVENVLEDVTYSYQLAIGLNITKQFTLNLIYEGHLESKGIQFENNIFETDLRTTQVIFSLGYLL